jgi:hypothetical protein
MPRGRKPKQVATQSEVQLKLLESARINEMEQVYKDVANIKHLVDLALTQIGFIDSCENLAEAAFKSGRAYGPLDKANDKLEEILENIYDTYDFDHWGDVLNNN